MESLKIILVIIYLIVLQGCNSDHAAIRTIDSPTGNVRFAERFTLEKRNGLSVLTILNPWQGARNISQIYYLAGKGEKIPPGFDTSLIIRTPVQRIIAMSTTYLSMITALGESDRIVGISGSSLLYDENLSDAVKSGKIEDVGYDDNLNIEMIVKLRPDLVMVYGIGGESSGIPAHAGRSE